MKNLTTEDIVKRRVDLGRWLVRWRRWRRECSFMEACRYVASGECSASEVFLVDRLELTLDDFVRFVCGEDALWFDQDSGGPFQWGEFAAADGTIPYHFYHLMHHGFIMYGDVRAVWNVFKAGEHTCANV